MSLLSAALRLAAPLPQIESFSRFLFIGPHPDDIEIGAGATAAKLTSLGKHVAFLICLDGRYGLENAPPGTTPEQLIEIRRKEARASAAALGVSDVFFLELSDGGFYREDDLLQGMARIIGQTKPELIFAPDPCVGSECHVDPLRVGRAAMQLAYFAPYEEIMRQYGAGKAPVEAIALYMTARPSRYVKTSGFLDRQLDAVFTCHISQFPDGFADAKSISAYLRLRSIDFGIRSLKGCAEGFRVLGRTQMHCLPEADKK